MSYAPSAATMKKIEGMIAPYPQRSAALLPVLRAIQEESGCVSPEAEAWVAAKLGIPPIRVREVISFYTMFRRKPAGITTIQVCRNLSCTLAGAEDIIGFLKEKLNVGPDGTTSDGRITLETVECLGNCDHAPCLQVDGVDHGPVTRDGVVVLLEELRANE
jgi:NADH-quinone oxidoreductase subunit E